MSVLLNIANGFKIKESWDGEKLRLDVEMLVDGEKFTEQSFVDIHPEQKNKIIANIWESILYNIDISRGIPEEEKEEVIQKIISSNVINGYRIIIDDTGNNLKDIEIEFLKNGEFYVSTKIESISKTQIQELKKKLNNFVFDNLNVKVAYYRPIYLVEMLAIIL